MARNNKPKFLTKRRRLWYAVLDIPKDVRPHFSNKPRFMKSLGTDSLSDAERLVHPVVAEWKAQIEAARTGSIKPLQDLARAKEWGREFRTLEGDERENALWLVEDAAADIAYRDEAEAKTFYKIATGNTLPTGDNIESWLQASDNAPKTIDMKRTDVERFAQRFPLTHLVTRQEVQKWAHDLQHKSELSPVTVRRIISACKGYWTHLERSGVIPTSDDMFAGAVAKQKKSKSAIKDKRKPFTSEEVVTLLNAAGKRDQALSRLIWLSMWSGCRIEELCYLKVSDVKADRFNVTDAKTEAGERTIPIHSRLTELISHLSETTVDGFILSNLSNNKYGQRSNAIGKRFGRLKSKMGFGSGYVFHSFRMTVATELENAFVPETVAADILGHKKASMSYGVYSGGTHFQTKAKELEKLDYPIIGTPEWLL